MSRFTASIVSSAIAGILAHNPDTGASAPIEAPTAPTPAPTPNKRAKTPRKARPASAGKGKRAKGSADPMTYTAPTRAKRPAGFHVWADAFSEVSRLIAVRKAQKESGTIACRPGWTRAVWLDVAESSKRPILVMRGHDLTTTANLKSKSADSAELIWNDSTGAPRVIELAQFPNAKSAESACDALNTYFAARFGDNAARMSALAKNAHALQILPLILAQCGNDPQRFGRFGAVSAKQQQRDAKKTESTAKTLERLMSANNPALMARLAALGLKKV